MRLSKLAENRLLLTLIISVLIVLLLFPVSNLLGSVNERIKSFVILSMSNQEGTSSLSDEIVVVGIDEKTYEKFGFPFSRSYYATLIENINAGNAEVIGFDIMFANDNKQDLEGDNTFAQSIKDAGNIVLGSSTTTKDFGGKIRGVIEKPLEKFLTGSLAYGFYSPNIDKRTRIASSIYPEMQIYDYDENLSTYNHFSIALLKAYYSKIYNQDYINYSEYNDSFYSIKPGYQVPFKSSNSNSILINYVPLPNPSTGKISNFTYFSFLDVYEGKINPTAFEGKIVLIGATAKGIKDTFITYNGIEYGVFVLANAVNTILTKNYLIELNYLVEFFLIFLLIILSVYFNLSRSGYVLLFSNISISLIFLIIFPLLVIVFTPYLLNYLAHLFFALIISLTLSNTVKYLIENKNKNKLNKALSEYVSAAIADEIISNSGKLNLDGEIKKLAIYFSDIEGFTTISEKFRPHELVAFLRDYLSNMSNIIMDQKGFIDKYEGDAIMALWGSFINYDNGGYYACYSALEQQNKLKELNIKWKKDGFNEIKARIGIHIGEAIVGNIGSTGRKMEYTALGDSVNLGSRLEGVNKHYGTYICVSEVVYEENKEYFEYRYLDKIRVKGKNEPIKIYELLSIKGELPDFYKNIVPKFNEAMELYQNKDFENASKIFEELKNAGDSPSETYLNRCLLYIKTPPDIEWDGVFTMIEK